MRELTRWASPPTPKRYWVRIICPRAEVFDRWVTREDAEHDLLRSGLLAFPN